MQIITKLREILTNRIQFIESITLIRQFEGVVDIDLDKLKFKHHNLQSQQMKMIKMFLCYWKLNDNLQKGIHKLIVSIFKKIDHSLCFSAEPSGKLKQIISDYIKFFMKLKQLNILQFLRGLFQANIYNHNTLFYILIEVLLKYLRIKTLCLIEDKNSSQTNLKTQYIKINNCMNPERVKNSFSPDQRISHTRASLRKKPIKLVTESDKEQQLHKRCQTICTSFAQKNDKRSNLAQTKMNTKKQTKNIELSNVLKVGQKTITVNKTTKNLKKQKKLQNKSMLLLSQSKTDSDNKKQDERQQVISCYFQNTSISEHNKKKNRRVIKSYKARKQETDSRIMRAQQIYLKQKMKAFSIFKDLYLKSFINIFRDNWKQYYQVIGLPEPPQISKRQKQQNNVMNSNSIILKTESETDRISHNKKSNSRKIQSAISSNQKTKQWQKGNINKVIVEACYRNERICRQMEIYSESYNRYIKS